MSHSEIQDQADWFMEKLQAIDRAYEEYAKAAGMTYISMTVLETIYKYQDDCTQKMICELTHYPKQSVNLVVKSFWESGFVELRETPADRRNKFISLTGRGREYAKKKLAPLWGADESALAKLGGQRREELLRAIELYGQSYCENIASIIRGMEEPS